MISDFKVKNRSPPLKKKYQQLGIYQMHWHIASQVSKALYHESNQSPHIRDRPAIDHEPTLEDTTWPSDKKELSRFEQRGYDMIAIQALALKNSWSKERRLGWDGNSIRQLWSKRVGCGLLLRKNSSTLQRFQWSFLLHTKTSFESEWDRSYEVLRGNSLYRASLCSTVT